MYLQFTGHILTGCYFTCLLATNLFFINLCQRVPHALRVSRLMFQTHFAEDRSLVELIVQ